MRTFCKARILTIIVSAVLFLGFSYNPMVEAGGKKEAARETETKAVAAGEEFDAVQAAIKNFKSGGASFTTEEGKYTIGISMCLFDQPYWIGMYAGFLQGGHDFDAKIIMRNANLDIPQQMAHFQDYVTQKVDGLIIVPTDTEATSAVIAIANKSKIPVVEANRITSGGEYCAVMYDNLATGALAAEAVKTAADRLGFKEINVLELVGDLKIAIGKERHDGFHNKVKDYANMRVVSQMPTEWLHENVYPATIDGFSAHPEINAVYLSSDLMTQPCLSALDALKRLKPAGDSGHVIVVTVDGQPVALDNIRKGFVDASINNECFEIGYKSVETVIKMIKGENIDPKIQLLKLIAIDKSNCDNPNLWGNSLAEVVR